MNKRDENIRLHYILDIVIIVFAMLGSIWEIAENGFDLLEYYTTDSNIFIAIACLLDLIYLKSNEEKRKQLGWIKQIKFMATCAMGLTFFVVIFVLAPMGGAMALVRSLTEGALLYQHTLCPLLSFFVYFRLDCKQYRFGKETRFIGPASAILYAIITTTLNVKKVMYGPYPFLHVYEQPVLVSVGWFMVILSLAALISWVLWNANVNMWEKKEQKLEI